MICLSESSLQTIPNPATHSPKSRGATCRPRSWAAAHPQRDESGRLQRANGPGQGRRLLVPCGGMASSSRNAWVESWQSAPVSSKNRAAHPFVADRTSLRVEECLGAATGNDATSRCVYGCEGRLNTSSGFAHSTISPSYRMATRWQMDATESRSCEM